VSQLTPPLTFEIFQTDVAIAKMRHRKAWMTMLATMYRCVMISIFENLGVDFAEFIITFVSWPVNTAIPMIHSVFLSELPRRQRLSASSAISRYSGAAFSILRIPWKV